MRNLYAILCLVAVAYGLSPEAIKEIKGVLKQALMECRTDVPGTTDNDLAVLKAGEIPTTRDGKCFLLCYNKKFGWISADGKLSKEGAMASVEHMKDMDEDIYNKMKQSTEACFAQVTEAADPCDTAANLVDCLHKQDKLLGLKRVCGLDD